MVTSSKLKALIYLWTRDAQMLVNKDTEAYVIDHLQKLNRFKTFKFSDNARADMSDRISRQLDG